MSTFIKFANTLINTRFIEFIHLDMSKLEHVQVITRVGTATGCKDFTEHFKGTNYMLKADERLTEIQRQITR
jgi:hypothetical protein